MTVEQTETHLRVVVPIEEEEEKEEEEDKLTCNKLGNVPRT
jgi:hypothetical protein